MCLQTSESAKSSLESRPKEALVMTQAQARSEAEVATLQEQKEAAVGVWSSPLEVNLECEEDMEPEVLGAEFAPDLFREVRDRVRPSRSEKRARC